MRVRSIWAENLQSSSRKKNRGWVYKKGEQGKIFSYLFIYSQFSCYSLAVLTVTFPVLLQCRSHMKSLLIPTRNISTKTDRCLNICQPANLPVKYAQKCVIKCLMDCQELLPAFLKTSANRTMQEHR